MNRNKSIDRSELRIGGETGFDNINGEKFSLNAAARNASERISENGTKMVDSFKNGVNPEDQNEEDANLNNLIGRQRSFEQHNPAYGEFYSVNNYTKNSRDNIYSDVNKSTPVATDKIEGENDSQQNLKNENSEIKLATTPSGQNGTASGNTKSAVMGFDNLSSERNDQHNPVYGDYDDRVNSPTSNANTNFASGSFGKEKDQSNNPSIDIYDTSDRRPEQTVETEEAIQRGKDSLGSFTEIQHVSEELLIGEGKEEGKFQRGAEENLQSALGKFFSENKLDAGEIS